MINVEKILNTPEKKFNVTYNQRDLIIYAIGIGEFSSQFTNEQDSNFAAFPLYPSVLPFKGNSYDVIPFPPENAICLPEEMPIINPAMVLHGEQFIEIYEPLNPIGSNCLQCTNKIISFLDKGKGALIETETIIMDEYGKKKLAKLINGTYVRGLTGFQGKTDHKQNNYLKEKENMKRPPDCEIMEPTLENQAKIYRLSGDYNMLHIDKNFAQMVGFKKPILHGLCSFAIAGRILYKLYCKNKPENFISLQARFSKPCFPGETLIIKIWNENNITNNHTPADMIKRKKVFFSVNVKERNNITIIDFGKFIYNEHSNQPISRL